MKRILKIGFLVIAVILAISFVGFFVWTQQTFKPTQQLEEYVGDIQRENDWVVFKPDDNTGKEVGVILYPGAKVEPEAYSYLGKRLADKGYIVGIPKFNLNLSMFETNKADEFIDQNPDIKKWYIGGHSLGGVSAATYARKNQDVVDGLILLASYPSSGDDFSNKDTPILSIFAEKDGLTTKKKIAETKKLLPEEAVLYEIKGGNHAQFGMYGEQKGDKKADITAKAQQDLIVDKLLTWLDER